MRKTKEDFASYNLGDSDLELLYDGNTQVKLVREPTELIEYPDDDNRFPPYWKYFNNICMTTDWEKHLGIFLS